MRFSENLWEIPTSFELPSQEDFIKSYEKILESMKYCELVNCFPQGYKMSLVFPEKYTIKYYLLIGGEDWEISLSLHDSNSLFHELVVVSDKLKEIGDPQGDVMCQILEKYSLKYGS